MVIVEGNQWRTVMNNINFDYIVNCVKLVNCFLNCTSLRNIFNRRRG